MKSLMLAAFVAVLSFTAPVYAGNTSGFQTAQAPIASGSSCDMRSNTLLAQEVPMPVPVPIAPMPPMAPPLSNSGLSPLSNPPVPMAQFTPPAVRAVPYAYPAPPAAQVPTPVPYSN